MRRQPRHDRRPVPLTGAGVLAELARLGPFFALDSHPAQSLPAPPWRPLDELFRQPGTLGARVAAVRAALAEASGQPAVAVEPRVAASMAQLGLAGRLICPALGVAVLTGGLLDLDPTGMRWRPSPGGAVALSIRIDAVAPAVTALAAATAARCDPAALADALARSLLAGPVRALVEASRTFGVSEQVLWGNVASVVFGAVALIGATAPSLTGAAEAIATSLLDQPPLRGRHQGSEQGSFRRRSCCLVYRLAGSPTPVCGDCVLDRPPAGRGSGKP
jgi:ferric iron reductase protein FhuF